MMRSKESATDAPPWNEAQWRACEEGARRAALAAAPRRDDDDSAWTVLVRACRVVMRTYTTGFFVASRFLPRAKRDVVEAIYAAVRYPDEVVDAFPLSPEERLARFDAWAAAYERALAAPSLRHALAEGTPAFLAGFVHVVRRYAIPPAHYRDFLAAMRLDVRPRPFASLDDLIASYVHGSAIVVGWFLTHAYGAATPADFPRALDAARDLGIALQLTNFLRDVAEDHRRGRLYLPLDWLRAEGIERPDPLDPAQRDAFTRVIRRLADEAARLYRRSAENLDAYAADCRTAIRACIAVYETLNDRIRRAGYTPGRRASVPGREKWHALPAAKWWVMPVAYVRAAHDQRWLKRLAATASAPASGPGASGEAAP